MCKNTSEKLRIMFTKYGVRVCHKPIRPVLVHPKDKIYKSKKFGVVYRLKCSDCNSEYIAETGRCLCTSVSEQKENTALKEQN